MLVCFLLPNFLKDINLCARCHSNSPGDQRPLSISEAGAMREGTGVAALHAQVASPPSCHRLISVSGDVVALAHLGCGIWAEITQCGESFTNTWCPQESGLGSRSLLYTGLRRSRERNGFWVTTGLQI